MTRDQIAAKYIPCTCNETYKSRNMADPNCAFCQEDWKGAMDEYANTIAIEFGDFILNSIAESMQTGKPLSDTFHNGNIYDLFLQKKLSNDK